MFSFKGHYKSTRNRNKCVCKHVSSRRKCFILHCKHEMYTKVEKCSKSILLSSLKCNKKLKIKIHFLKIPKIFFTYLWLWWLDLRFIPSPKSSQNNTRNPQGRTENRTLFDHYFFRFRSNQPLKLKEKTY